MEPVRKHVMQLDKGPASSLSSRFWVATVTFGIPIKADKLEIELKRHIFEAASRLRVDSDFFGLTPLSDPGEDASVDIIAVSGLGGHAFGSWKSRAKHDMWLRDFLPEAVPTSRIFIYGYDTKLPGSLSDASILELSRRLLESVKSTRASAKNRPIIFIGHSLGNLVIKQVSRSGLRRGIENESLMTMVRGKPNEELVRSLSESSPFLGLLHKMSLERFNLRDSRILCVFETCTTTTVQWSEELGKWTRSGPNVIMVPRASAIHARPNEKDHDHLSINANHSDIVKFSDQSDADYIMIQSRLESLSSRAPEVVRRRLVELDEQLLQTQKRYIKRLKAPDSASFREFNIDDPTPGTLSGFVLQPAFQRWVTMKPCYG
ncbi:hypothetical protein VHEMI04303 [[Torrubiella] hemipterigena]|uniref:DUF676 domain-containing protein n=1 Tax=[Torrubiella] hemipterigena TaxID=1531966 RepID=A0A0A1TFY3_9HYPO|nr:hypothetical protein VHEMI04303 [[Torrubiella] hemipterigena]